eukprot:scaffold381_cov138-Cylindrotheca_fusiformis.AAC.18
MTYMKGELRIREEEKKEKRNGIEARRSHQGREKERRKGSRLMQARREQDQRDLSNQRVDPSWRQESEDNEYNDSIIYGVVGFS